MNFLPSNLPWYRTMDEVRTWIQDTTEYFALPDLNATERHNLIVPQASSD